MFESLSSTFQKVFRNLRGYGALSESNIRDSLRDVRMALLEADVHFTVVKQFIDRVREGVLGKEVLGSVSPGQQFVKFVYDEMVATLGGTQAELVMAGTPATLMLCGLHGSGKTTTAGKLARWLKKRGRNVLLVKITQMSGEWGFCVRFGGLRVPIWAVRHDECPTLNV